MQDYEQGVKFSFDLDPYRGYGNQNDHNFANYIADALDLHLEDPFPLHNTLEGDDEALVQIRDRMRSFAELDLPETTLSDKEIAVAIELLGVVRERNKAANKAGELDNPYAALCTRAMITLIASLQARIGEDPIEQPQYPIN